MLPTRQISQSKPGWPFEQKRENARSPTGRSHLTDTLSLVHQQHLDCASPTCLQHPTCRWSRCVECIWIHHIFYWQNPGSCAQGRAVTGVFRSVKWRLRPQLSPPPPQKKKKKVAIKLGDKTLPQVETPTFLGVKLDTRLSWKSHIEDMEKKGIKTLTVLENLSRTHWGANSKILKAVYKGAVRPALEYGASAWVTAA